MASESGIVRVQVGKSGITAGMIAEIAKHLKSGKAVNVRFLKAFVRGRDRHGCAFEIENKLGVKGKLVGNVLKLQK
jgi:RNA-binding protein YhbY